MTRNDDDGAERTPLQRTRHQFGWSVARLSKELRRCSAQVPMALGSDESLKTQISRHENGHVTPDEYWRKLYRLTYGRTDEELGFPRHESSSDDPPSVDDLQLRLATACRVDPSLVQAMQDQVHHVRLLDRRLGAPSLLEQTRAQITTLSALTSHSLRPSVRSTLAAVLSDAGALAAWQALGVGAIHQAWGHYETARAAAREADSPVLLAHAMGEQAYALLDLDRVTDALDLVQQARRLVAWKAPKLLLCWLRTAEAEMQARTDPNECRRTLERAAGLLPRDTDNAELPYISLDRAHHARWRGHCLALLGDPEAIDFLTHALDGMDESFVRAEAGLRCDLAHALIVQEERHEARAHVRRARLLANQVGSVRQRKRIAGLGHAA